MAKTKEKDVLLICKGWYNKKYKTVMEALEAYQSEKCCVENVKPISILWFCIYPVVEKYFQQYDWRSFLKEGLIHDVESKWLFSKEKIELTDEYICKLLITQICLMKVRDDNGWIIDLSDYEDIKEII